MKNLYITHKIIIFKQNHLIAFNRYRQRTSPIQNLKLHLHLIDFWQPPEKMI